MAKKISDQRGQLLKGISTLALAAGVSAAFVPEAYADEITVTATRREATVADVPYNISALSGDDLDAANVTDFSKLTRVVPGLQLVDRGVRDNSTSARLIIRGMNTESSEFADYPFVTMPTVGTYVGETPLFVNLRLTDIQRVEVLRGPQGTLYGAGAMGGAVRFIHNNPNLEEFEAKADATVSFTDKAGDPNYSFNGLVNVPLGGIAALRVSGGYDKLAGFIDAPNLYALSDDGTLPVLTDPMDPFSAPVLAPGEDVNDADQVYLHAALRVEPTDYLSAQFNYHYQKDDASHRDAQSSVPADPDFTTGVRRLEPGDREIHLYGLDVEMDFGFATLTSASAYYENEGTGESDLSTYQALVDYYPILTAAPGITTVSRARSKKEIFTQEVRLVSQTEGALDWILGAFYMDESTVAIDEDDFFYGVNLLPAYYIPYYSFGGNQQFFALNRDDNFQEIAVFGELTYHITDAWQVTGGFRVFWQDFDSVSATQDAYYGVTQLDTFVVDESDVLFKANTSYDFSDSLTAYATFSQGYRRGGGNSVPAVGALSEPALGGGVAYTSDSVNNYEIGFKGKIADRHNFSTAFFYIDWKDAQLGAVTPDFGWDVAVNAGDVESYGFEGELSGSVTDNLSYALGYSFTDASLAEDFVSVFVVGVEGDTLPGVSKHAFSGSVDYVQPLSAGLNLVYHVDGSYRSSFVNAIDRASPIFREFDGFGFLAASLSLQSEQWRVSVFAENLTNAKGVSAQNPPADYGPAAVEWIARPRTIGVRTSVQF